MSNKETPEFSKSILVDLVLMCQRVEDKPLRSLIHSLSRQIRFNEPVAYPGHEVLDKQIKEAHQKLIALVDAEENEEALKQAESLQALFTKRDELVASMK